MADMEAALAQLDKASNEPLYQTANSPDQPVNSIEVQAATIFDATVLSQVSKVSKPVIGVSKVLPVFSQFFTLPFLLIHILILTLLLSLDTLVTISQHFFSAHWLPGSCHSTNGSRISSCSFCYSLQSLSRLSQVRKI